MPIVEYSSGNANGQSLSRIVGFSSLLNSSDGGWYVDSIDTRSQRASSGRSSPADYSPEKRELVVKTFPVSS